MKRPRLFFFDIDGTLIDDKTKIAPDSALDAVRALQDRGDLVFVNSGRTSCFLRDEMTRFGISSAVCGCGTQVIVDGKTILEQRVSAELGRKVRRLLAEFRLDAVLEAQEGYYYTSPPFEYPSIMEPLFAYTSKCVPTRTDALENDTLPFDKFCIQTDPGSTGRDKERMQRFIERLPEFQCIARGRGFYECVPAGSTKGTAIRFVQDFYGIPSEDCYVFGDSVNDLTMFTSGAGHRILMEEHDPGMEQYATFITRKVSEDGVRYALQKLGVLLG